MPKVAESRFFERLRSQPEINTALLALDQAEVKVLTLAGWTKAASQGWVHPQLSSAPLSRSEAILKTRRAIIRQQLLHG
jgi:hypothetical protein